MRKVCHELHEWHELIKIKPAQSAKSARVKFHADLKR